MRDKILFVIALIGGLWILIQVIIWISEPRIKLSADYSLLTCKIPEDIVHSSRIDIFIPKLQSQIDKALAVDSSNSLTNTHIDFGEIYDSLNIDKLAYYNFNYSKQFSMDLQNVGKKDVLEIELIIPGNFKFELKDKAERWLNGDAESILKLGNLKPNESIFVRAFCSPTTVYNLSDIKVNYSNGRVKLKEGKYIHGFLASLSDYCSSPMKVIGLIISIVTVLGSFLFLIYTFFNLKIRIKQDE
ncbi:MAG: hypothetical protein V2A67_12205 [Bacteroidota bacterium]